MEKGTQANRKKARLPLTPSQSDVQLDEDPQSSNIQIQSDAKSDTETDTQGYYKSTKVTLVSKGINTTPRATKVEDRVSLKSGSTNRTSSRTSQRPSSKSTFSRSDDSIYVKNLDGSDTDSNVSDRSPHSSVVNSIVTISMTAKEGCAEGLTGFIVTGVSMFLLIMISWFLISQLDFFLNILTKMASTIVNTLKKTLVFQNTPGRAKHIRRKLSLYAEKED